jgi:hypothetical protein
MSEKATHADAELILKLFDLRREAEMRKARNWWVTEFWPETADDVVKVAMKFPSQENNWIRQVGGYWEMAAALVNHGVLNQDLFVEPGCSGEMFFIFAKVEPFLKELREKMKAPDMFGNIEKVVTSSEKGRQRIKNLQQRFAERKKMMSGAAKAS